MVEAAPSYLFVHGTILPALGVPVVLRRYRAALLAAMMCTRRPARLTALTLLLLIDAGLPGRVAAEVREQLVTTEYAVRGDPSVPLLQLLNRASPVREGGKTFHGYTKWTVNWRFRWRDDAAAGCRISGIVTQIDGRMTLPRLVGGSADQRQRFETYLQALRQHEMGHFSIARQAGREIDAGILALPPMRDCASLDAAANALGYRVLDQHLAREKQYDASTGHGRTQGAWLDR
jgi:predicted secreted Zn-dependent protease